jgi:hypothetical protein
VPGDPVVERRAHALLGCLNRMPQVNSALPELERAVLALLADDSLDDADIASVLGIDPADVAELAGSARLRIARTLGLGMTPLATGCGRARLADLSASIDDESGDASHVHRCPECRNVLAAMRLADRMYRSWTTVPMPDWLWWRMTRQFRSAAGRGAA